jgi:hypothetical protein
MFQVRYDTKRETIQWQQKFGIAEQFNAFLCLFVVYLIIILVILIA